MSQDQDGTLVVLDGGDGSGKATQAKLVVERSHAEGIPLQTYAFPRYETPTGKRVKQMLKGEFGPPLKMDAMTASKFFADDRLAAAPEIRADLAVGTNVLLDRYVSANMFHQGSKIDDPVARMEFFQRLWELEYETNKIPRPDLNIVLHVPADIAMSLIEKRGNEKDGHENLAHLERVEATYLEIVRTFPGFVLVECVENGKLLSIPEIHEKIWTIVSPLLVRVTA